MAKEIVQQVKIWYLSDVWKVPEELNNLAKKYNCESIQFKGDKVNLSPRIYCYSFLWPMSGVDDFDKFIREAHNLEKVISIFPL